MLKSRYVSNPRDTPFSEQCGSLPRGSGAFTLIEVLMVLIVLVVLVALSLPVLSRIRAAQKRVACLNNTRTVLQASLNYSNDDNGGFPILEFYENSKGEVLQKGLTLSSLLGKSGHLKEKTVICPIADKSYINNHTKLGFKYAINIGLIWSFPKIRQVPAPHSRVSLISEFYADTCWRNAGDLNSTMNKGIDLGDDTIRNAQYHGSRQERGLHMGFLDGHCELIQPEKNDWSKGRTLGGKNNPGGYYYTEGAFNDMKKGEFAP